eukprot:4978963-Karenia_brevis.AAC.1
MGRKLNLAGHTSRREDGRWSTKLLTWRPQGCRAVGHPVTRWRDAIKDFHTATCGWMIPWQESASKRGWWKQLGVGFAGNDLLQALNQDHAVTEASNVF